MDATDVSSLTILIVVAAMWFGGILLFVWGSRKKDLTPDQVKMMSWAKVLVASAEQLYETNEEKLRYVTNELVKQAATMQTMFTEAEIRAFTEWAVFLLKRVAIPLENGGESDNL